MSNEPASDRLIAPPEPAQAASEADRMRAAIKWMDAAMQDKSGLVLRLQADLRDMADVIARAKTTLDISDNPNGEIDEAGALLRDLEIRVTLMLSLTGWKPPAAEPPAPEPSAPETRQPEEQALLDALAPDPPVENVAQTAPESAAKADRVPTVSHVVSQLRGDDAGDAEALTPSDAVARLEAMVEKLTASMPAAAPPEAEQTAEAVAEEAAQGEPPARAPTMPEVELLSNFARMDTTPYLPGEIGTAVIFEAKSEPVFEAKIEPQAEAPAEAVAAAPIVEQSIEQPTATDDADLETMLFEPPSELEDDPAAELLEPPKPAAPPDPLAPLMAMSPEEKIALFG